MRGSPSDGDRVERVPEFQSARLSRVAVRREVEDYFAQPLRDETRVTRCRRFLASLAFEGELSPRALGLVMEWAAVHRGELMEDWNLARQQQPLKRIAPLE